MCQKFSGVIDLGRPTKADRQARIVAELRAAPTLRVTDLVERLGVSAETIRRDLTELDKRDLITRTYGGAVGPSTVEPAFGERQHMLVAERERMAMRTVELLAHDDIVMVSGGSSTLYVARRLPTLGIRLTVITHAPSVAMAIGATPLIRIIILPGEYDAQEGNIVGADTIETLQRYRANCAVLGATGLTAEGPNEAGLAAGQVHSAMMRRAASTIVVADHSKFDRQSLVVIGPWSDTVTLVTDCPPPLHLSQAIESAGSKIVVAGDGNAMPGELAR
jgi:DeoR/GlpR family transcriptional regulator of sugar metabolism